MRIFPSESLSVFTASINRHAGFLINTAKLEWASRIDSLTDSSTNNNPFIPSPMIGLFFASTYPNSQITPSLENFFLYFFKYSSIWALPVSSSPSITNFMLQGTSLVVAKQASTALILVINSPLSSVEPLPKILFPFLTPLNGGSSHKSKGSAGWTS